MITAAQRRSARRYRLTRTISWASLLTCLAIAAVLWYTPRGPVSLALAVLFAGCFIILVASLGAFHRSAWVADAPADAHLSRWDDLHHEDRS
nr:hypothetical protein [Microbacterium bovistercoris]